MRSHVLLSFLIPVFYFRWRSGFKIGDPSTRSWWRPGLATARPWPSWASLCRAARPLTTAERDLQSEWEATRRRPRLEASTARQWGSRPAPRPRQARVMATEAICPPEVTTPRPRPTPGGRCHHTPTWPAPHTRPPCQPSGPAPTPSPPTCSRTSSPRRWCPWPPPPRCPWATPTTPGTRVTPTWTSIRDCWHREDSMWPVSASVIPRIIVLFIFCPDMSSVTLSRDLEPSCDLESNKTHRKVWKSIKNNQCQRKFIL